MKRAYLWAIILIAVGQLARGAEVGASKREPTYEAKPAAFWMGELRAYSETKIAQGGKSDETDPSRTRLVQAFQGLGLNGVPYILAWDWRGKDGEVDNGGPAYVNFALKCLSDHDKEALTSTLDQIGRETKDPQVLAAVIAAFPQQVSNPLLKSSPPLRDKRITLALEVRQMLGTKCKWKEPMPSAKKVTGPAAPLRSTNSAGPVR
jgi:hypothetical protein